MGEQTTSRTPAGSAALELAAAAAETLFHTSTGTKLHIRTCSHFDARSDVHEATPTSAESRSLCEACSEELAGRKPERFDSLDTALAALPVPVESLTRAREIVRGLLGDASPEQIWIPYSRPYVALGGADMSTIYVGRTYVERDRRKMPLDGHALGNRGSEPSTRNERETGTCSVCWNTLPNSGVCDCQL